MNLILNSKINYNANNVVAIVVTGNYETSDNSDAGDIMWTIVNDFSSLKTLFPNIVTCNMTYPDGTSKRVGTKRDLTFEGGDGAITTEELTEVIEMERMGTYKQLQGLPVTGYTVTYNVMGESNPVLTWMINYTDTSSDKETLATQIVGFFKGACTQLKTFIENQD